MSDSNNEATKAQRIADELVHAVNAVAEGAQDRDSGLALTITGQLTVTVGACGETVRPGASTGEDMSDNNEDNDDNTPIFFHAAWNRAAKLDGYDKAAWIAAQDSVPRDELGRAPGGVGKMPIADWLAWIEQRVAPPQADAEPAVTSEARANETRDKARARVDELYGTPIAAAALGAIFGGAMRDRSAADHEEKKWKSEAERTADELVHLLASSAAEEGTREVQITGPHISVVVGPRGGDGGTNADRPGRGLDIDSDTRSRVLGEQLGAARARIDALERVIFNLKRERAGQPPTE